MPLGFNWKTSYCPDSKCKSKSRTFHKLGHGRYAQCGKCAKFIGWVCSPMPKDMALEVVCGYGARYNEKKLGDIPRDYIEWLYNYADKLPFELDEAVNAIMEQ